MKFYLLLSHEFLSDNIEKKVNLITQDAEFKHFKETAALKKMLSMSERTLFDEIILIDLSFEIKEEEIENIRHKYSLPIIKQSNSNKAFVYEVESVINNLHQNLEEYKREFPEEEKRESDEPLHIYHKDTEIVEVPVTKYVEVPVYIEKEKGHRFFGKREKEGSSNVHKSVTTIIGITGAERGAGATSFCIELAKDLARVGKVAILDKTERNELEGITLRNVDIYTSNLGKIGIHQYGYIIIDFGTFFEIGKMSGIATIVTDKETVMRIEQNMSIEKNYCKKIICVCPAAPWKLYKTDFLVNNLASAEDTADWILLFNGNTKSEEFALSNFMRPIILTYENDNYLDELKRLL